MAKLKAPLRKLYAVILAVIAAGLPVASLASSPAAGQQIEGRWYTEAYVAIGEPLYQQHCAACHGVKGQGLAEDWKKRLPDGSYPPPPLNGTAHTWHHSMSVLVRTIQRGGAEFGGKMPAFAGQLSTAEMLAIIAYLQNWWPEEIYQAWQQRGGLDQ